MSAAWVAWWMVWLACAVTASAQVVVTKGPTKRSIALSGFRGDATWAAQVADVLRNDLRISGHFTVTPSAQAELIQSGAVRVEGNQLVVECTVTVAASKQVALSKAYTGSVQDWRRVVHRVSDDIVSTITGQPGIAQTRIAFVWVREGVKELAVMDYDGHNVRQLTHDKSLSVRPRWSPDGRRLIYTSYVNRFPDVVEADLITGTRRIVASFPGLNSGAAYSPDGQHIALTLSKDGNPELYVMSVAGSGLLRLTNTRAEESSPVWSPDGQQIAYVSAAGGSPQIWVIGRNGGEARRLTVSPSYNTEPDWSRPPPNGELPPMIAMTSRVGGRFRIGLYDWGAREVRLLETGAGDAQDASWAPNGRHLVFAKVQGWRSRLYLLDALSGEQVELPAIDGSATEPAWGPLIAAGRGSS